MIPHPLNLAYCLIVGEIVGRGLLTVLLAVLGLVSFAAHAVLLGSLSMTAAGAVIGAVLLLAAPFAVGFVMRWLTEPDWRLAAVWAVVTHALFSFIDGFSPASVRSAFFAAAWTGLWSIPGSFLGAWVCEKARRLPFFEQIRPLFQNLMVWER